MWLDPGETGLRADLAEREPSTHPARRRAAACSSSAAEQRLTGTACDETLARRLKEYSARAALEAPFTVRSNSLVLYLATFTGLLGFDVIKSGSGQRVPEPSGQGD